MTGMNRYITAVLVSCASLLIVTLLSIASFAQRTSLLEEQVASKSLARASGHSQLAYDGMYDVQPATWYFPGPSTSVPSTLGYTYGNAIYQSPGYTADFSGYPSYPVYNYYSQYPPTYAHVRRDDNAPAPITRRLRSRSKQQSLADTDAIMQTVKHVYGPDGSVDGTFTLPLAPPPPLLPPPRPKTTSVLFPRPSRLKWSYGGDGHGPHHWASLNNWGLCGSGQYQSPINLELNIRQEDNLDLLRWVGPTDSYTASLSPPALTNAFRLDGLQGSLRFRGDDYDLSYLVLHTPSEHRWQGKQYPLEVQLMHKRAGSDAIGLGVSVFMVPAAAAATPPALRGLFAAARRYLATDVVSPGARVTVPPALPPRATAPVTVNTAQLMADVLGYAGNYANYLSYYGSITSPPCSEGVTWAVLKTPLPAAAADYAAVAAAQGATARPTQPVYSRVVYDTATGRSFQTPSVPPPAF